MEMKKPLPVDEAFVFSAVVVDSHTIHVAWKIIPGYYLYADRLHFSFKPTVDFDVRLPETQIKKNLRGDEEVYSRDFVVPIILKQANLQAKNLNLTLDYQGCSERGFCYPPQHKMLSLDFSSDMKQSKPDSFSSGMVTEKSEAKISSVQSISFRHLLMDQHGVRDLFHSRSTAVLLLLFAGLGLLLAFTPCVLPMIPILTSIIIGHKQPISMQKAFLLSSTYVLGSSLTYALAGVAAASMGSSLQVFFQQPWIICAVGGLFILLSLSLFGVYELRLPSAWQNRLVSFSHQQRGGTYVGVLVMGAISTLVVSPCVTAPLVGVLIYIAESGNVLLGASALFAMGIGMGIPLILIGISTKCLPKRGRWMKFVQYFFGVLMIVMAVWIFSRLSVKHAPAYPAFTIVHNVEEVNKQLLLAQARHKPVILDFYADWCESCVEMDEKVFSLPDVMNSLHSFLLLRADLSKNNAEDEALLKNYNVVAPPTVIFFNDQGREMGEHRIVGGLDSQEFMTRIHTFITNH